jgi:dienelactone hydrolase
MDMNRRSFLAATSLAAAPRSGYETWSWERWREITREQRLELSTTQAGRPELATLADGEWPARRAEIEKVVRAFFGPAPALKPPLEAQVLETVQAEGYTRRKVRFQSEAGEFLPAYLLVPDALKGRSPAILCPHQTTQEGMREPAGLAGKPRLHMAHELAQAGYVTLTWDALAFGERHTPATGHYGEAIAFYQKHPEWSLMGKMVWDASRAIDYLETLDFVDPARIASIGHSHGAYTTYFTLALEPRLCCAAASCGFDTFRYDGNPYRWSHATALLPRLGFYISSPYINMKQYSAVPDSESPRIPFDLHEVVALAAPRPLLFTAADDDKIFPNSGWSTRKAMERWEPLWARLGARGRVAAHYFRGGHSFPPEVATRAYGWLERWLRA